MLLSPQDVILSDSLLGFDILNPVQVLARGMDTKRLREEYGQDIVFWGGGVDTQHVLPFGKPEELTSSGRCAINIRDTLSEVVTASGEVEFPPVRC